MLIADWVKICLLESDIKVKKGSVADVMGHLLPGDEVSSWKMKTQRTFPTKVIEWQGRSLQSRSYEEVALP